MNVDYSRIGPFLIAALVVFIIYRRLRRNFGQQPLRPVRMRVRIGLFLAIGCMLAPIAARSSAFLAATAAGIAVGVSMALYGAARTRFVRDATQVYYVPHTYTGIAVSLLFLGTAVVSVHTRLRPRLRRHEHGSSFLLPPLWCAVP